MDANPYQALGVDPKAKQSEIKTTYRKLAKKYHPDLNPGNKKAENRFKEITAAYAQVGTTEARAQFDQGELEVEAAKKYQAPRRRSSYNQTQGSGGPFESQYQTMDEDLLRSLYEQINRSNKIYQLDIDFKVAILGGEQEMEFPGGKKMLVKIPAGVESGTKLRFPENMYVQLNVKPSSIFKRVGINDIETQLKVSFSDAMLGAEVEVPTVERPILMKIPANVTTDQKLRLKGKGVFDPATNSRGDQIVVLKIKMPEHMDEEFKKAIKDWSDRQTKGA